MLNQTEFKKQLPKIQKLLDKNPGCVKCNRPSKSQDSGRVIIKHRPVEMTAHDGIVVLGAIAIFDKYTHEDFEDLDDFNTSFYVEIKKFIHEIEPEEIEES